MSIPDDGLEARVSLLEQEVARLREYVSLAGADAGAARVLASGADRDVAQVRAELRAHTQVLNALRETQLEQSIRISSLEDRLSAVEGRLSALENRLSALEIEMREGFAMMRIGMARIVTLLGGDRGGSE